MVEFVNWLFSNIMYLFRILRISSAKTNNYKRDKDFPVHKVR
jgi:hypothetical protein